MTSDTGHNFLIVDDSSTVRAFMRRAINLSGFKAEHIFEAGDGDQALTLLNKESVDIVLADLHMPGMDGEEMTRRILSDPTKQNIAVIVISADPNVARIQSLLSAGAKGYLAKPFTAEAFRDMLSNVIGGMAHV